MLQVRNLSISLDKDERMIINDLSFSVNKTDKIGLIGEEGNGKSLLLKSIVNRDLISEFCTIEGDINKKGELIGYLPQIIEEEVLKKSPSTYILEELSYDIDYKSYYTLLEELNISDYLAVDKLRIKDLSGGERIKLILLLEILKSTSLLLLDEPSNDLDLDTVLWLEEFIKNTSIPVIFVSHDQRLLTESANRIIHLETTHGRKKAKHSLYKGGYDDYLDYIKSQIENDINQAISDKKEYKIKLDKYHRVYHSVNSALRATKNDSEGKNLKDKMHTVKSIGKKLEKEKDQLRKMPDMEDPIDISFDEKDFIASGKVVLDLSLPSLRIGDKVLAYDLDLKVIGPEKICIIGPNGSGKTTLIKEIVGEITRSNLRVGYMPQNYFDLEDFDITAIDYLSKTHTSDEHTRISTYLGSLNFSREEMYTKIKSLSGGQKAKLYFAKMNLDRAQVLVLDEPTRNLSPTSQDEVISALKEYNGPIISVSHDRNFIENIPKKIYKLENKKLIRIK